MGNWSDTSSSSSSSLCRCPGLPGRRRRNPWRTRTPLVLRHRYSTRRTSVPSPVQGFEKLYRYRVFVRHHGNSPRKPVWKFVENVPWFLSRNFEKPNPETVPRKFHIYCYESWTILVRGDLWNYFSKRDGRVGISSFNRTEIARVSYLIRFQSTPK